MKLVLIRYKYRNPTGNYYGEKVVRLSMETIDALSSDQDIISYTQGLMTDPSDRVIGAVMSVAE